VKQTDQIRRLARKGTSNFRNLSTCKFQNMSWQ